MGKIHVLDPETINKIAAGEVVERPVSVVKECVENAIDAGADAISVEIEDGGLKQIRITDNGSGMSSDDLKTAFIRHATSKISNSEDLNSIASLGFRGEALATVAAVSMVECISKTTDDLMGSRYVIEGGIEKSMMDVGAPNGTTLIIKELFYNVPARKKFLKAPKTEGGYITDLIQRLALSHPGISFKYSVNKSVKLHTSGNYSLTDCIYQIFGKKYAKNCHEVNFTEGDYTITGVIGDAELSRGNRQYEIYFVNGRYLKSKWIQRGIETGMKSAMMINQFPFAVMFLECPSDWVDVNVHPTKMEARFKDEEKIEGLFRQAVIQAVQKQDPIRSVSLQDKLNESERQAEKEAAKADKKQLKESPEPFEVKRRDYITEKIKYEYKNPVLESNDISSLDNNTVTIGDNKVKASPENKSMTLADSKDMAALDTKKKFDIDNSAGIVSDNNRESYIHDNASDFKSNMPNVNTEYTTNNPYLSETKVSDTEIHAKPDDINKETLKGRQIDMPSMDDFLDEQEIKKHSVIGQLFNTYWMIQYNKELYIIDHHAAREKVLYEHWVNKIKDGEIASQVLLEPFVYDLSDNEFQIYEDNEENLRKIGFETETFGGTSIILRSVPYLLNRPLSDLDFIYLLDELYDAPRHLSKEEPYLHQLASVACKAAIKGNDNLSELEYRKLIESLLTLDDPYHCPHGRPTMIRLSQYEIEKKFKRIT